MKRRTCSPPSWLPCCWCRRSPRRRAPAPPRADPAQPQAARQVPRPHRGAGEQSEALFQTLAASLKTIREQEKTVHDQLAAELDKPSPDACAVGGYVLRLDGFHGQAEAALRTFDTAFSAILTANQLAKYNALKELAGIGRGGGR